MDLAKIRQKARQEQEHRRRETSLPLESGPTETMLPPGPASSALVSDDEDFFQNVEQPAVHQTFQEITPIRTPSHRLAQRDPLEVILAGREIAGCGENQSPLSEVRADAEKEQYQEFLCFKVSNEVYGVNIMDIKELIKPRDVTEVPRAPSFVSGIISLRGVIIPIIDMPDRLGLARETITGRERVIVVRHGSAFSGLLVDEIIQVVRIATDSIEVAPPVLDGIDRDFVTGIGRSGDRMIILLNLNNIIDIHLY
jgi:purine-binding chemotaxis protein CheW